MSDDIWRWTATRIAAAIRARDISAGEALESCLGRMAAVNPGLNAVGGIPNRTTVCTTLSPSGVDDTAAIQSALNTCPANQVVKLNAGTFKVSGDGLAITRSNVVLRGSGPSATRITRTDAANFPVVIIGNRWASGQFFQSVNLAFDGMQGSNTITLASAPNPPLTVGEIVYLDQSTNPNITIVMQPSARFTIPVNRANLAGSRNCWAI